MKILEEKERLIVEGELENIKDPKKDKEVVASLSFNNFLFNITLK